MVKAGYDKKFASGVICAGGCLGILIPPSIMLIVYSVIAQLSPLRLICSSNFSRTYYLQDLYIAYAVIRAWFQSIYCTQTTSRRYSTKSRNFKRSTSIFCPSLWIDNASSWNNFSWDSNTSRSCSSRSIWCNNSYLGFIKL